MTKHSFAAELDAFRRHIPDLTDHPGEYAVIIGARLVGAFPTYRQAQLAGHRALEEEALGLDATFLVKKIAEEEITGDIFEGPVLVKGEIRPQGPLVAAIVRPIAPVLARLSRQGDPHPQAEVSFLIDTGASISLLDEAVLLHQLRLKPTGLTAPVSAIFTGPRSTSNRLDTYAVDILLPTENGNAVHIADCEVAGHACMQTWGVHGLLGRDLLDNSVLTYYGGEGLVYVTF